MKKFITAFLLLTGINFYSQAQWVSIPDTNFGIWLNTHGYNICLQGNSQVGWQMDTTCSLVVSATALNVSFSSITNLDGSQYFDLLTNLTCYNNSLTSLPPLPPNLMYLSCWNNQLNSLPSLPVGLTELRCMYNQLTTLPPLPNSLGRLYCNNNLLTTLPALPGGLYQMDCSSNQITSLPALPNGLPYLTCYNNLLTTLPTLPNSMGALQCRNNRLTSLPILPSGFTYLSCDSNQLTSLPALPNTITELICDFNQLTTLPTLPDSLARLYCSYNLLSSLPTLPDGLVNLNCYNNQLTSLPILPNGLYGLSCYNNQLASLPALPNSLDHLRCWNNQLSSIPVLPDTISFCLIQNNPITCLPRIMGIGFLDFSNTLVTCLPNYGRVMNSTPNLQTIPLCQPGNANGCAYDTCAGFQIDSITTTDVFCFGEYSGTVCANVSGGILPYSYAWSMLQTTQCVFNLPAGNYAVTVVDIAGCSASASATVTEPTPINLSIINTGNGILPDTLDVNVSGGCGPPYSYQWYDGSFQPQAFITTSGNYALTVMDACGCTEWDTITIGSPSLTVTYPNGGETFSTGQNVTVTWTSTGNIPKVKIEFYSSIAFTWITLADSVVNSGSYLFTIPQVPNMQGRIRISDPYNSLVNDQSDGLFSIVQTGPLIVNAGADITICYGDTVSIGASPTASGGNPPYRYHWTPSTWMRYDTMANPSVFNFQTTNYTVVVEDGLGATSSDTVTVTVNSNPVIDSITTTNVSCFGSNDGFACVYVSGGSPSYNFQWQPPVTNTSCGTNLVPGTYPITVTDQNNCTIQTAVTITEPPLLTAQIISATGGILPDTVSLNITGGTPPYLIIWGTMNSSINQSAVTGSIIISDTVLAYYVQVRDANNCNWHSDTIYTGDGAVWPGDADHNGIADNNDLLPIGLGYGTTGTPRSNQDIVWDRHWSQDWTDTLPSGSNYKHIDCNGDGTINADDTLAILQNYGQVHAKTDEAGSDWRMTDPALLVELTPDTTQAGDTLYADITLGDINLPASNVYGLAFTLHYDAAVVDSSKTKVTFGNSWFGNATDKISIAKDLTGSGQLKLALTRIDHTTRSGFGQIGQVQFVITTDNINGKNLAYYQMNVWISGITMIDNLGNPINVNAGRDSSQVEFEPVGIDEIRNQKSEIRINPNPASDEVMLIVTEDLIGGEMKVLDVQGRILTKLSIPALNFELRTLNFSQGIYFIQVITGKGMLTKRLVIAR